MARTKIASFDNWKNYHDHEQGPVTQMMSTELSDDIMMNTLDKYKDAAAEIQGLLKAAHDSGERFRAFGAAWSLSSIPYQKDRMHFNGAMNLRWAIRNTWYDANTAYADSQLFLFQCGNTIKEVSALMKRLGKSLPTSGESNGQTIAGAISTGVHGSSIDQGGIQDSVVGLNLIIGPNPEDIVYVERASKPALSPEFSQFIGTRLIRDDEIFNAALVGLGAFGFIHGVVLKSVDLFYLKRYTKKMDREEALQLAETLDFSNTTLIKEHGYGTRPYFLVLYINPYRKGGEEFVAEMMFKVPKPGDGEVVRKPIPRVKKFRFKELTTLLSWYASQVNVGLPSLLSQLQQGIFPKEENDGEVGTVAEHFWDSSYQGKVLAVSFGLAQSDIRKAIGILTDLMRTEGPIPALAGIRFVKGGEATLGFTRFEQTCIMEFAGVPWKESNHIIAQNDFIQELHDRLKAANIPFTHHWGKMSHWAADGLVNYMYGERLERWKGARYKLLNPGYREVFTSEYLDMLGLSGPPAKDEPNEDPIA